MQDLLIPTKIVKSKRRSISLIIENNGDFIVRAPLKAKENDIYKFIAEKSKWIISKRTERLHNKPKVLRFNNEEENVSILGNKYTIKLHNAIKVKILDAIIYIPEINSKEKLIQYLKKLAKQVIDEELKQINKEYGLTYSKISINSAKTRWGSCNAKNKLNFTYKLMLCPIEIVRYVVIHEICHTKVKNHGKGFWKLVKEYCPNYKTCEKWLKDNRSIIELI